MSRFRTQLAAAAAMLAFGPLTAHGEVVSALAEVTNFSVKLTDLNAFDFKSPSLKAGGGTSSLSLSDQADLSGVYVFSAENQSSSAQGTGTLIDPTQLRDKVTLNAGLAQASKNGGNLSSRIGADAATFANVPFGFYRGASEGASIQSSANSVAWWTLSGNTDAVFSGTLRLQANADVSGLVANPYLIDTGVRAITQVSGTLNMIAVRDGVQVGSVFDNGQSFGLSKSITFSDTVAPAGQTVVELGETGDLLVNFEIHVKNTSSQSVNLFMETYLSAFASVNAFQNRVAVPEPGTWVLMLLGLGGLAVAARRQPRQS